MERLKFPLFLTPGGGGGVNHRKPGKWLLFRFVSDSITVEAEMKVHLKEDTFHVCLWKIGFL